MKKRTQTEMTNEALADIAESFVREEMRLSVKGSAYLGGGAFGRVCLVETEEAPHKIVVKAMRAGGMHRTEAFQLKTIAKSCPVKMPAVYALHDATQQIPFDILAMEYIPGVCVGATPKFRRAKKAQKVEFANAVADGLLALHAVKGNRFGELENPESDVWETFYYKRAKKILAYGDELYAEGKLLDKHCRLLRYAFSVFPRVFAIRVKTPVLLHADLNIMNMMSDAENLRLAGFIDPFNSMWGDRVFDLFQLRNMWGDKLMLYETYKQKAGLGREIDLKCAFYAYFNEVYCSHLSGTVYTKIMRRYYYLLKHELKKAGMAFVER